MVRCQDGDNRNKIDLPKLPTSFTPSSFSNFKSRRNLSWHLLAVPLLPFQCMNVSLKADAPCPVSDFPLQATQ